jgi:hypothetical protein
VADREFVFGNEEVQKLINERFIPLAMDDFYLRRQEDAAGKFFRKVANQGPRKGEGGATRQGRYVFTADGVLLGYNNNRSPERMIAMLNETLTKFENVAISEKTEPSEATGDDRYSRVPPEAGAVVRVFTRVLESRADGGGGLQRCPADTADAESYRHNGFGAAVDHLWIQKDEIVALENSLTEHAQSGEPLRFLLHCSRASYVFILPTTPAVSHRIGIKARFVRWTGSALPQKKAGSWASREMSILKLQTAAGDSKDKPSAILSSRMAK